MRPLQLKLAHDGFDSSHSDRGKKINNEVKRIETKQKTITFYSEKPLYPSKFHSKPTQNA